MRTPSRLWDIALGAVPFVVAMVLWQALATSGLMPRALFPDLPSILDTFVRLSTNGILVTSVLGTLARLLLGFAIGALLGGLIGLLMGRSNWAEDVLLPIVSAGYPIPSLAYAPLFVLWFGLGNLPAVLLVAIASAFPVIINTWKGVRAVKQIWVKSARVIGANELQMFTNVILPGSLPYILTGLRVGLAQAWRVLVGVEMLTGVAHGLGSLIFGAQQFLNTDVMLAGIAAIGILGFLMETQIFARIERLTLKRWGLMA